MAQSTYWASRSTTYRTSRRRFLAGSSAGAAGVASLAVLGCGDDDKTPPGAAAPANTVIGETPKPGGTLHMAAPGDPAGYDPHLTHSDTLVWPLVLSKLMTYDATTLDRAPNLALTRELPEPNRLVLKLAPGVKWHNRTPTNGRALTSEDVAFSIDRSRGQSGEYKVNFKDIASVEAPDPQTVVVRFATPSRLGLNSILSLTVVAKEQYTLSTPFPPEKAETIVGTGPFMMDSLKTGIGGRVVRNRDYFRGAPLLDAVEWTFVKDPAALLAGYRTGGFDLGIPVYGSITADQKQQLSSTNKEIVFKDNPQGYAHLFIWNLKRQPFSDLRVRQALDLALNRQQMIALNAAGVGYLSGPYSLKYIPKFCIPETELLKRPGWRASKDDDIKNAKALLSAAGLGTGFTIEAEGTEFNPELNRDPAILLASDMKKFLNIDLKITRTLDRAAFLDVATKGDFNFRAAGIGGGTDVGTIQVGLYTGATRNYAAYSNARLDKLFDQEVQELDDNRLIPIMKEIQAIVLDEMPYLVNYWGNDGLVFQPGLKTPEFTFLDAFTAVQKWSKTTS